MRFGCAWYPEHWSESRWPVDLGLMRDAGMNVVRVGEFAWSRMEPEEGRYDLDWLARAIGAAAAHGIDTVIGTPSAAPPAWLTRKYPDTLLTRDNGQRSTHGNRCHFSPTSERYIGFCRQLAEELARRFGRDKHVLGWQIDNEYSVIGYDDATRAQFQDFLRSRYGTLDHLNERWTTAYWSQTYTDWSEIPLPVGPHHPGLMLEFRRFVTHAYRHYQGAQIEAIRRHSDRFITHNALGWFEASDWYLLASDLDFLSWDSYVGSGHLDPWNEGAKHDLVRGIKRKPFWLMETQPGSVNWAGVNNVLHRGEVRTMAWHAVGHGADAVLYWQWRSALHGQEQYHGSLVAQDGRPRPVYDEVRSLGADFQRAAAALEGTTLVAACALLDSHDDRWALIQQRHHAEYHPEQHAATFYRPLRQRVDTVDVVDPRGPIDGYRLLVAPHLHLVDAELAGRLERFVRDGGHLVLGARTGVKDDANALLPSRPPGPLAALLGAHIEEYYALDATVPLVPEGQARIWAEWIEPDAPDVEVLLRYGPSNGWLDGRATVVRRAVGAGSVTYVGGWLDEASMGRLVDRWLTESRVPVRSAPSGVELCRRVGPSGDVWIAVNHGRSAQTVTLPVSGTDLLSGRSCAGSFSLAAYDVVVVAGHS